MNFIDVDNFVTSCLKKNIETYNCVKHRLKFYNMVFDIIDGRLKNHIKEDMLIISELEFSESILTVYKKNTQELIREYLKILKTPIKRNDVHELKKADEKKAAISKKFIDMVKLYVPHQIFEKLVLVDDMVSDFNINYCGNCENTEHFMKEGEILICYRCFSEVIKMSYFNNRSFNTSVKCNYDRISHFKECLKQYQGKQNTFICPTVYADIESALRLNGVILENKKDKFKNVKRSHVMYFLKELGYTKHYDDYILIHHNLTGKPAHNLLHLEEKLICDFEQISEKYSQLYANIERKNFINMQFILYRLLQRHNFKFDSEDFETIKSFDKNMDRDKICKTIFESLGWEYD